MFPRGPEPRRFFGDPASLARDNIFGLKVLTLEYWMAQKVEFPGNTYNRKR